MQSKTLTAVQSQVVELSSAKTSILSTSSSLQVGRLSPSSTSSIGFRLTWISLFG
jgi:hypothetical protein